jgi:hypothetical protein
MSHHNLTRSTSKGTLSAIRATIHAASEAPRHSFVFDNELMCTHLRIRVNNIEEQITEVYVELAAKNKEKLKGKRRFQAYSNYFTPLTLLCFYTFLCPSYALKIKKQDINFADKRLKTKCDGRQN